MAKCESCGKALLEDMLFCPYCGHSIVYEDSEHFELARGEVVIAVASPSHIVGQDGTFAMAITTQRLLFARIESIMGDKVKGEFLQAGIFLPGSSTSSNVSRFYEMTPEQVLEETTGNFFVNSDEVEAVRLSYDGDDGGRYVVKMRWGEERMTFTLPYDRYYRDLLFRVFEGRMSW